MSSTLALKAQIRAKLVLLYCASLTACTQKSYQLKEQIPANISWTSGVPTLPATVEIPGDMLEIHQSPPRATAIWQGPGSRYGICTKLLEKSSQLLVLKHQGNWLKVIVLKDGRHGWLPKGLSKKTQKNFTKLRISPHFLTLAITSNKIKSLRSHLGQTKQVNIPKGSYFLRLQDKQDYTLLWLLPSKAVAWIERRKIL